MVGDDGDVVAVLDWEICTLGDPLADVGLLHGVLDAAPATSRRAWTGSATTARRLPGPRRARSPATPTSSGRDLEQIDFYVAFAFWKLACILEGVYARYLGGALGAPRARRARRRSSARSTAPRRRAAEHLERAA